MKKIFYCIFAMATITLSNAQDNCEKIVTNGTESRWDNINPTEVAKLHNDYLEKAIKLDISDSKLTKNEILLKLEIPVISLEARSCFINNINTLSQNDLDKIITKNFIDKLSIQYYNKISNALSKEKDYSEIEKDLNFLASEINNKISGRDKDFLITCLETGKASAYFWLPKEKGGYGLGYEYLVSTNLTSGNTNKTDPDTRFRKDMRGAGYGMVCWSFSAFLGPVGGAGLVYGAVTGALTSSFLP